MRQLTFPGFTKQLGQGIDILKDATLGKPYSFKQLATENLITGKTMCIDLCLKPVFIDALITTVLQL